MNEETDQPIQNDVPIREEVTLRPSAKTEARRSAPLIIVSIVALLVVVAIAAWLLWRSSQPSAAKAG